MNVRINASSIKDSDFALKLITEGREIEEKAEADEKEIIRFVEEKLVNKI